MQDQASSAFPIEELDELYREIILDHYHHPHNQERLPQPDIQAEGQNPFCGDEIALQVQLRDGRVAEVGFQGRGCSISQASASMMSELLKGKTLDELAGLFKLFQRMLQGKELTGQESEGLGELTALAGVRKYPVRIKCALLGWTVLEEGVEQYQAGKKS